MRLRVFITPGSQSHCPLLHTTAEESRQKLSEGSPSEEPGRNHSMISFAHSVLWLFIIITNQNTLSCLFQDLFVPCYISVEVFVMHYFIYDAKSARFSLVSIDFSRPFHSEMLKVTLIYYVAEHLKLKILKYYFEVVLY